MATVTLTSYFSALGVWPGNLLSAADGGVVTTYSATTYAFTYDDTGDFPGYTVTVTGTDFTYDGTVPTGGTMSKVVIADDQGHTLITISGLASNALASDLSAFSAYCFGWTDSDGGSNTGEVNAAWSMLFSGKDVINGTSGDDFNIPGLDAGNDTYNLYGGDDYVSGGIGNDTINGGDGWDTLDYGQTVWNEGEAMVRGITVKVDAGTVADPYGFTDKFTGIEQFRGTPTADIFYGGAIWTQFEGMRGADTFYGGTDGDWLAYQYDAAQGGTKGIIVKLGTSTSGTDTIGSVVDGFGTTDKTVNIQNVGGTVYGDSFTGSKFDNSFAGGEGQDTFDGGLGEDTLTFDWWFGNGTMHGIKVNLSLSSGQIKDDGFGNTETAINFEDVHGSNFADSIVGTANANYIVARDGADTMTGGGGADTFAWWYREELGDKDVIKDFHTGSGSDMDVLELDVTSWGGSGTLHLVNGTKATAAVDTFIYNASNHTLSWDPDGTGAQPAITVAVLSGVESLSAANFDLF